MHRLLQASEQKQEQSEANTFEPESSDEDSQLNLSMGQKDGLVPPEGQRFILIFGKLCIPTVRKCMIALEKWFPLRGELQLLFRPC